MSIWYDNKNLGNIRYYASIQWQGQVGSNKGFAVFDTFRNGVRAMALTVMNDVNAKKSVAAIIKEYAPSSDGNNTNKYIENVETWANLQPTQLISNAGEFDRLIRAMIRQETSQTDLSQYEITSNFIKSFYTDVYAEFTDGKQEYTTRHTNYVALITFILLAALLILSIKKGK
jgi:hypothetical protein